MGWCAEKGSYPPPPSGQMRCLMAKKKNPGPRSQVRRILGRYLVSQIKSKFNFQLAVGSWRLEVIIWLCYWPWWWSGLGCWVLGASAGARISLMTPWVPVCARALFEFVCVLSLCSIIMHCPWEFHRSSIRAERRIMRFPCWKDISVKLEGRIAIATGRSE